MMAMAMAVDRDEGRGRGGSEDRDDGGAASRASLAGEGDANFGWDGEGRDTREEDAGVHEQRENWKFMFGNVDDSGALDEEYLDKDARELLSAFADQLGPSLVDLELSTKRKGGLQAEEEQADYAKKAENAVDYEDIQEEYEGPEVQLRLHDEQFYAQAALAVPHRKAGSFVPEEDNYDEDDDEGDEGGDREETAAMGAEDAALLPVTDVPVILPPEEKDTGGDVAESVDFNEAIEQAVRETDASEEGPSVVKVHQQDAIKIELPVLCEEAGKKVLRFSELFGATEPYWVQGVRKSRQKRHVSRERIEKVENEVEALEEDEEEIFKFCPYRQHTGGSSEDVKVEMDDSSEVEEEERSGLDESGSDLSYDTLKDRKTQNKGMKLQFCPAQPMKPIFDAWDDIVKWRDSIPEANFVPIHQQEWEDNIVWDVVESCNGILSEELQLGEGYSTISVEVDSDSEKETFSSGQRRPIVSQKGKREEGASAEQQTSDALQWTRPSLLEPLSRLSLESEPVSNDTQIRRHPQMLRLESWSHAAISDGQERKSALGQGEQGNRLSKLSVTCNQRNRDLAGGSWLDDILWNEESPTESRKREKPRVIYDLQDTDMVFEIPNNKRGQSLRVHASAVVLSASGGKDVGDGGDVTLSAASSFARFNISNDKYYTNKKTQHQQKSNAKKRAVHGVKVMHSLPSIKLQTMKPKLTNKDLANFHRPKAGWYPHHNEVAAKEQGKLAVKGPLKVILKTLGGKGTKLYVDASETLEVLKAKAAKKLGDLKASEKSKVLYSGKELEEGRTFAEQQVPTNSVLHLVRTKVHPWPKAQRLPGENKPMRPPGAFKKKSELSVKDGHVALMEYCEERPLLLSNVGMGARLSTYYRKLTPTDSTAVTLRNERGSWVGVPLPLEPTEDSPFLGDIRPGDTVSSLETNMYRSPAFGHKVPHTDFLLVRSAKGKLSLRRIDSLHVVGQQEPHLEVLTPTSKTVQNYIGMRLLVYVYREFRNNEKPTSTPRVRADELISQFPSLTEGFIRKRLKHCADLQKGSAGEMWWVMRRTFRIPSDEELRRMITPEMVCTYESMQAGLHHLKRMGVQKLTQSSGLSAAMNMLPDEAITLAAASHIERELQITPWNLSSNFVSATLHGRGSLERLEITGAGDPSGRGLGFSYLRVATKPPNVGAIVEKKAAVARGGGAVTGTDADLRRLSMDAAREVLLKFKVSEAQIEKLTRWHRIALVRKLSSEQAASLGKVGVAALNKFARGQRMSFLQLQQQTREKCQEIWDHQAQSLAAAEGEDSESDGEANGDLDSFAGDLENLLEAEEGEDGDDRKGRRDGMRGLGARRRVLQAQKEEEMEDEEAEAAELRRMLLEDDEAEEEQKKKKSGNTNKDKSVCQVKEPNGIVASGSTAAAKKKKRILKRIIRTKKADGTFTSREVIITDPKEVAAYLAKKSSVKIAGPKSAGGDKVAAPKKGPVKPKKEKKPPLPPKDVTKAKPPVKKVVKEGAKEKPGRDGLRVVCGACGQLGHMRTNKKCPLYMEDSEGNLQRHDSAAAEGLLERQGTKITIKKKKIDELQHNNPSSPLSAPIKKSGNSSALVVKPSGPPVKIPSLKIKMQPPSNADDLARGSKDSKIEKTVVAIVPDEGVIPNGTVAAPVVKGSKLRILKKNKKVKLKEKAPVKQQQLKKLENAHDQPAGGNRTTGGKTKEARIERERREVEKARQEDLERAQEELRQEEFLREQEELEIAHQVELEKERQEALDRQREQMETEKSRKMREQKKKERQVEKQKEREKAKRLEQEKVDRDREEQDKMDRLNELREKKKQRKMMEEEAEMHAREVERLKQERERERKRQLNDRLEKERLEKVRADYERLENERLEYQRLEIEKLENERLENERLKEERLENERLEKERMEQEKLEAQRRAQEEKKRQKSNKLKSVRHEELKDKVPKGKLEKERLVMPREDKSREQNRPPQKARVSEKVQLPVQEKAVKRASDVTRDFHGEKREMGRTLKKRSHLDFGNGPQRPSDPPKRQRTRGGGEVDLANMLETIVNLLWKSKVAYLFVKPVPKKDAPDYLTIINRPMDLSIIRENVRKMVYKTRDEFRVDVEQIVENAHTYNEGRHPAIPPLADALLELCDEHLIAKRPELEAAEDAIERFEQEESYRPKVRPLPSLNGRRKARAP